MPEYQSHRIRTRKRNARDKSTLALFGMTEEEARSFDYKSDRNAELIKAWTTARGCGCDPYKDVFSLKRWNAQGHVVNSKHTGLRIRVISTSKAVDRPEADPRMDDYIQALPQDNPERIRWESNGTTKTSVKIAVWCRCQTRRRTPADGYTATTYTADPAPA